MSIVQIVGLAASILDIAAGVSVGLRKFGWLPAPGDERPSSVGDFFFYCFLGGIGCFIGAAGMVLSGIWGGYYVIQQIASMYLRIILSGGGLQ